MLTNTNKWSNQIQCDTIKEGKKDNKRKMFSPLEDFQLRTLVQQYGTNQWKKIADVLPDRTPRQCRERYKNYLAPDIINAPWTRDEDISLKYLYTHYGPKWSIISQYFKTRSEVNVKNRWTSIGKMLQNEDIQSPELHSKGEGKNNPCVSCFIEHTSINDNSLNHFELFQPDHCSSLNFEWDL